MITQAVEELAAARAQTIRIVAPLTERQLAFSPAPRHWSIGEIIDHLLLAEGLYRGEIADLVQLKRSGQRPYRFRSFDELNVSPMYMPDALLQFLEMPLTLMSRFVPDVIRDVLTEYAVVPTRNPDRATPRPNRPGIELRAELMASLENTRALLAAHSDLNFHELVVEHPLTGASDVPRILVFLARHERRHQGQIARVMSHASFPSP